MLETIKIQTVLVLVFVWELLTSVNASILLVFCCFF